MRFKGFFYQNKKKHHFRPKIVFRLYFFNIFWYNIYECGDILETLKLKTEFITLGQFLKIFNIISSGGEAKFFLQDNFILVNGEKEQRRGRKLYPGYTIEYKDIKVKLE